MHIYAIQKTKGPTSYDIIRDLKHITHESHIGHAGTLDPLASGVLVVGIGREATKKLHEAVQSEKEYIAKVKLGEESTTDDEEGEKIQQENKRSIKQIDIEKTLPQFTGEIIQIPPVYSAIKIKGKEAYKRVRGGEAVKMEPRKALIKEIEILNYAYPFLELRVTTGPGVYIRALARDIGRALNTGGYLTDLERTRVGDFTKEKALTLKEFTDLWEMKTPRSLGVDQ